MANWYPNFESGTSRSVQQAFRVAFDAIYQLRDRLSSVRSSAPAQESNVLLSAESTGALSLTTGDQDVPGVSLTLSKAGVWIIVASVTVFIDSTDGFPSFTLDANGVQQIPGASFASGTNTQVATTWHWTWTAVSGGQIVKLVAKKAAGAGTSQITPATKITALWVGP